MDGQNGMANWLERFDEVWAETENLPSPYQQRQRELDEAARIAAIEVLETANLSSDVLEMLRTSGIIQGYRYDNHNHRVYVQPRRSVEFIEWSFTDQPADLPHTDGTGPR